jgi:O-acetyl-ADP-ribose deacetylase (regulator of RNase III)
VAVKSFLTYLADPNPDVFLSIADDSPLLSWNGTFEELEGRIETPACIANAGNSHGIMGAGVAGAIQKRYGTHVKWNTRKAIADGSLKPEVGQSYVVRLGPMSHDSSYKYCAYTITMLEMGTPLKDEDEIPYRCMLATLHAVEQHNREHPYREIRTLVVPAFGAGIGGLDPASVGVEMALAYEDFL